MSEHTAHLRHAIRLSAEAGARGDQPFGALLVQGDVVLGEATNTTETERDLTRHAELSLLSQLSRRLGPDRLQGATLYSSCEPCPMCAGAIAVSGVVRVVYACSGKALRELMQRRSVLACREVLARSARGIEVIGPELEDEALSVHRTTRWWETNMATRPSPDFARRLAPWIQAIPGDSVPGFLACLERGAAARYRSWAEESPEHAEALLACAAREDEIADRVEKRLPADAAGRAAIEEQLPGARDAYLEVFAGLPREDQWRIQADAERQGAAAWRGIASQHEGDDLKQALEDCAKLEEESAEALERLIAASG